MEWNSTPVTQVILKTAINSEKFDETSKLGITNNKGKHRLLIKVWINQIKQTSCIYKAKSNQPDKGAIKQITPQKNGLKKKKVN